MESIGKMRKSLLVECWQNEYAEFFLQNLKEKEAKRPITTLSSPQLKYRGFLVLKMRRVTSRLALGGRVLHAGVRLLDVFMDAYAVSEDRLLHIGLICLLIATKFEVKGIRVPKFSEFCEEADIPDLSSTELWSLEFSILQHMRWDLCTPTVPTFLEFYRPLASCEMDYQAWCRTAGPDKTSYEKFKRNMNATVKDFMNLTLSDMRFAKNPPSLVAGACIYAMRVHFGLNPWPAVLQETTALPVDVVKAKATLLYKMMLVNKNERKRRHSNSEDERKKSKQRIFSNVDGQGYPVEEDLGYCTAKSSPESQQAQDCDS